MRLIPITELSRETGLPLDRLRDALEDPANPLRHIKSGEKRSRVYVSEKAFREWLEREEDKECGA